MTFFRGNKLGTILMDEGLCPKNAKNVELHIPADGVVMLRYEVFVSTDDLPKLTRAFKRLQDEEKALTDMMGSDQEKRTGV